jgi:hypothetical protein
MESNVVLLRKPQIYVHSGLTFTILLKVYHTSQFNDYKVFTILRDVCNTNIEVPDRTSKAARWEQTMVFTPTYEKFLRITSRYTCNFVLLGVTCHFILEFASCRPTMKRAMCQHLVEQCMNEIYSIYSSSKIFCLLIESQFVMSSMPKRHSCINIDFLKVTLSKTLCNRRESRELTYLCSILFHLISQIIQALYSLI